MKHEARNTKLETNSNSEKAKPLYDLEERTLEFAKSTRSLSRVLARDIANNEDIKQLVRSSGSVGANYIEANDSLSKKDFLMRVKIAKKEAKESIFWLRLLKVTDAQEASRISLMKEAAEIMNILGAIQRKSEGDSK